METILFADVKQIVDAFAILAVVYSVYSDYRVQGFATGVDEHGDWQLELPENGVLLLDRHAVRFNERVSVVGDVFVLYAVAVEGVESYPCATLGVIVAENRAYISVAP